MSIPELRRLANGNATCEVARETARVQTRRARSKTGARWTADNAVGQVTADVATQAWRAVRAALALRRGADPVGARIEVARTHCAHAARRGHRRAVAGGLARLRAEAEALYADFRERLLAAKATIRVAGPGVFTLLHGVTGNALQQRAQRRGRREASTHSLSVPVRHRFGRWPLRGHSCHPALDCTGETALAGTPPRRIVPSRRGRFWQRAPRSERELVVCLPHARQIARNMSGLRTIARHVAPLRTLLALQGRILYAFFDVTCARAVPDLLVRGGRRLRRPRMS